MQIVTMIPFKIYLYQERFVDVIVYATVNVILEEYCYMFACINKQFFDTAMSVYFLSNFNKLYSN